MLSYDASHVRGNVLHSLPNLLVKPPVRGGDRGAIVGMERMFSGGVHRNGCRAGVAKQKVRLLMDLRRVYGSDRHVVVRGGGRHVVDV